jgi:hypothetical protein
MEQMLLFMDASLKKSRETGCSIVRLQNSEEEFQTIATKNNVALKSIKKMEPSKVEAMLHDAGIGKSNSMFVFTI